MPPFISALIGKLIGPLAVPVLLAGLALSLGGTGLTWWHLHQANNTIEQRDQTISDLKLELANSKLETVQTQKALSDFHAQVEKDRADANAEALAMRKGLEAQIAALSSKANAAEAARRKASTQLLDALHAIPVEQQNALSSPVRDALRRVRDQQTGGASDGAAPASGSGQDGNRIPAAAAP